MQSKLIVKKNENFFSYNEFLDDFTSVIFNLNR